MVLLENGRPGYVINQWIAYLLDEEITDSRLEEYVRSLCHLYEFHWAQKATFQLLALKTEGRNLLEDFFIAKRFGTDRHSIKSGEKYNWLQYLGLYWKPLTRSIKTLRKYQNAINEFDEWQVAFNQSLSINPYEEKTQTTYEIFRELICRSKYDVFLHLYPAREHTKKIHKNYVHGKYLHRHIEQSANRKRAPKAFPLDRFPDLIQTTPNVRDKLLWLLMGAGSLRSSETLHLFLSDVDGVNKEDGAAKVILDHPEFGYINWEENSRMRSTTREEYFRLCWKNEQFSIGHPLRNLQPRTKYGPRNSKFHAGFKGMTFGENESRETLFTHTNKRRNYNPHYIWWLDVRYGQLFHILFNRYFQEYFAPTPKHWPWHPWLIISTNKTNHGMPFTIPALKQAWKRALHRIGMEDSGLGVHSLRHMYGYYCANILNIPLEITQMRMHHANISSTMTYHHPESSTIRKAIEKAAIMMDKRISDDWSLLANEY
jgi:integrase